MNPGHAYRSDDPHPAGEGTFGGRSNRADYTRAKIDTLRISSGHNLLTHHADGAAAPFASIDRTIAAADSRPKRRWDWRM